MGAVAEGWILGLSAGAEVEGLTGPGVDFVGEGLPAHRMIIRGLGKKERGNLGQVEGARRDGWLV